MRKIERVNIGVYENVICNGFMIDTDEKIWRMNTRTDAVEMLGEIDTPAEVQAVLWLNNKHEANSYRKVSNGYEVRINYNNSSKQCGDRVTITNKGEIVNYRSLRQKMKKNSVKGLGKIKKLSLKEKENIKVEKFTAVATGSDGSVYAIGSAEDNTKNMTYGYIVKFDKHNKKIWSRTIAFGDEDYVYFKGITLDKHNYLYVVGMNSTEGEGLNALIVKFDKKGNRLWTKTVGGTGYDEFKDIVIDKYGNIYASGQTSSNDGDVMDCNNGDMDTWLVKFGKNGKKMWDRTNGGSETDALNSISIDSSGNLYAAGEVESIDGDISHDTNDRKPLLIKFDKNGHKVWDRIVVQGSYNYYFVDSVVKKGRIYAAGTIGDPGVVRFDKDGNIIWKKRFGVHSSIEAIDSDNSGNLYAAAGAEIIKVNKHGKILWQDKDTFGYFYDVSVAKNGHIYAVGKNDGHAYIVEFDENVKRLWVRGIKDAR
jgi:hypothetical protein